VRNGIALAQMSMRQVRKNNQKIERKPFRCFAGQQMEERSTDAGRGKMINCK
jgi:hypothetical protein